MVPARRNPGDRYGLNFVHIPAVVDGTFLRHVPRRVPNSACKVHVSRSKKKKKAKNVRLSILFVHVILLVNNT